MNNQRRKRINQSIKTLETARASLSKILEEQKIQIKVTPKSEEDLLEKLDEIVDNLEETVSSLDSALETLNGADF